MTTVGLADGGDGGPHVDTPEALRGFLDRFPLRHFTDAGGSVWAYRDTLGSGPVVVFLPGAAGGGDTAFRLVEGLEDGFRCLSITYPGGLPPSMLAQGLLDLLDHLGLASVAVWGSSYGAWWAQEFARRFPERTSALWLGNVLSHGSDVAHLALFDTAWLLSNTADAIQAAWLKAVSAQPESELRSLQLYFVGRSLSSHNLKGRLLEVAKAHALPPAPQVPRTVVLECANDPTIGPAARERVATHYPQALRLRWDEGGHYPHLTHPHAMLPALRQWLGGSWSS